MRPFQRVAVAVLSMTDQQATIDARIVPAAGAAPRASGINAPELPGFAATRTPEDAAEYLANTILVADDDPAIRKLIEALLKKSGYDVITAGDGQEVLDILKHKQPALLLLDGEMPRLTGFETCRLVKTNPQFTDTPIIFLTALSNATDKVEGFQSGGADYLIKPVEKTELLARIQCHLELAVTRQMLKRKAYYLEVIAQDGLQKLEEVRSGQESLLASPESFPNLRLGVKFHPASVAGGDFYEIACPADDTVALLVADVAGHDLSTPFITGALKALAASFINEATPPAEVLGAFNRGLLKILGATQYVTACCAMISISRMEIDLASAGHPPAMIQKTNGNVDVVDLVGDPLGMHADAVFGQQRIRVAPGDRIFLYTDGLIEGYRDPDGRTMRARWGMEQLRQQLKAQRWLPVGQLVDSIVDELLEPTGWVSQDDIVLLGLEL